jgi:hypothetical protein
MVSCMKELLRLKDNQIEDLNNKIQGAPPPPVVEVDVMLAEPRPVAPVDDMIDYLEVSRFNNEANVRY